MKEIKLTKEEAILVIKALNYIASEWVEKENVKDLRKMPIYYRGLITMRNKIQKQIFNLSNAKEK